MIMGWCLRSPGGAGMELEPAVEGWGRWGKVDETWALGSQRPLL